MVLVPSPVLAVIDVVGVIGFLVAALYGWRNYRKTMHIGVTWLIYVFAMLFYAAFAVLTALEVMGVYPAVLEEAGQPLFAVAVAGLVGFAMVASVEPVKPE